MTMYFCVADPFEGFDCAILFEGFGFVNPAKGFAFLFAMSVE